MCVSCIYNNFLRVAKFLILDKAEGLLDARNMSDIILRNLPATDCSSFHDCSQGHISFLYTH
jgi:hypothetical protein